MYKTKIFLPSLLLPITLSFKSANGLVGRVFANAP